MPQAFFSNSAEEFTGTYGFPRPSVDEDIVVYCRSGRRAVTACQVLEQAGYKKWVQYGEVVLTVEWRKQGFISIFYV